MTQERNIKTENIFSVLQEEDTEPLREGKVRGTIRKAQSKRKGESETGPKSGLPKKYSKKGTQKMNCGPLRYQSAKCHNEGLHIK